MGKSALLRDLEEEIRGSLGQDRIMCLRRSPRPRPRPHQNALQVLGAQAACGAMGWASKYGEDVNPKAGRWKGSKMVSMLAIKWLDVSLNHNKQKCKMIPNNLKKQAQHRTRTNKNPLGQVLNWEFPRIDCNAERCLGLARQALWAWQGKPFSVGRKSKDHSMGHWFLSTWQLINIPVSGKRHLRDKNNSFANISRLHRHALLLQRALWSHCSCCSYACKHGSRSSLACST